MGCCRRIFDRNRGGAASVICIRWVLPLRLFILGTIVGAVYFTIHKGGRLTGVEVLLVIVHLILSCAVLNACQRSASYHRLLKRNGR